MHPLLVRFLRCTAMLAALSGLVGCTKTTLLEPLRALWVWVPDSQATLARQSYSGFSAPDLQVVTNPLTWAAVWQQIYIGLTPGLNVPAVNFADHTVLVAAMGTRPTGGYAIRIDSLVGTKAGAVVYVTETSPGATCVVTQSVTSPVHAVVTSAPIGVSGWRVRQAVAECP